MLLCYRTVGVTAMPTMNIQYFLRKNGSQKCAFFFCDRKGYALIISVPLHLRNMQRLFTFVQHTVRVAAAEGLFVHKVKITC